MASAGTPGRLTAEHIGRRVVVRRRVASPPPGRRRPLHTDLLGELVAITPDEVIVRDDGGVEHRLARTDITAAKPVPPRPARPDEIIALERIADQAWPAPIREGLGDWILRATDGWSSRGNSALGIGDPGRPVDEAIEACIDWYGHHRLTPRITVPLPAHYAVASELQAREWQAQPTVLVQTALLADVVTAASIASASSFDAAISFADQPSHEFLDLVANRRHSLPEAAVRVLCSPPRVSFAEVRDGAGSLLAIARAVVVGEGEWLHVGLVDVVPAARRRGLARTLMAELARRAVDSGARRAVLQVEAHNEPALRLYAGLGFHTHHRYVTYFRSSI